MSTCIITGATSGIGQATAIEVSKRKDYSNIVIIGRRKEELMKTMDLMEKDNKKITFKSYDLMDLKGIPALIDNIYNENGSIDCLLNIAGYTDPQPLLTTTEENYMMTYTINVFAPLLLTRECVKHMKQNKFGAKILNVASTAGITPRPGWISYSSSKAALVSASQTLASELEEYGIKVYCISPGRCATALRKKLAPEEDPTTIMQPDEVAKVICGLVDKEEQCMDGQNIIVKKKPKK